MRKIIIIALGVIVLIATLVVGTYHLIVQQVSSEFTSEVYSEPVSFKPEKSHVRSHTDNENTSKRVSMMPPKSPQITEESASEFVQPLVRISPIMPKGADRSGRCIVLFDVSENGYALNAQVVSCTHKMFEKNALIAVVKNKYRPRYVNGEAVVRKNAKTEVRFVLTDKNGNILPE